MTTVSLTRANIVNKLLQTITPALYETRAPQYFVQGALDRLKALAQLSLDDKDAKRFDQMAVHAYNAFKLKTVEEKEAFNASFKSWAQAVREAKATEPASVSTAASVPVADYSVDQAIKDDFSVAHSLLAEIEQYEKRMSPQLLMDRQRLAEEAAAKKDERGVHPWRSLDTNSVWPPNAKQMEMLKQITGAKSVMICPSGVTFLDDYKETGAIFPEISGDFNTKYGTVFEYERAHGRQVTFIRKMAHMHLRLEFASNEDLESAADLLTDPGAENEIVKPLDLVAVPAEKALCIVRHVDLEELWLAQCNLRQPLLTRLDKKHQMVEAKDVKSSLLPATTEAKFTEDGKKIFDRTWQFIHAAIPVALHENSFFFVTGKSRIMLGFHEPINISSEIMWRVINSIIVKAFSSLTKTANVVSRDIETNSVGARMNIQERGYVRASCLISAEVDDFYKLIEYVSNPEKYNRITAAIAAGLHAANVMLKKANQYDCKIDDPLIDLELIADTLLPTEYLRAHYMLINEGALNPHLIYAVHANHRPDICELVMLSSNPVRLPANIINESVEYSTLQLLSDLKVTVDGCDLAARVSNANKDMKDNQSTVLLEAITAKFVYSGRPSATLMRFILENIGPSRYRERADIDSVAGRFTLFPLAEKETERLFDLLIKMGARFRRDSLVWLMEWEERSRKFDKVNTPLHQFAIIKMWHQHLGIPLLVGEPLISIFTKALFDEKMYPFFSDSARLKHSVAMIKTTPYVIEKLEQGDFSVIKELLTSPGALADKIFRTRNQAADLKIWESLHVRLDHGRGPVLILPENELVESIVDSMMSGCVIYAVTNLNYNYLNHPKKKYRKVELGAPCQMYVDGEVNFIEPTNQPPKYDRYRHRGRETTFYLEFKEDNVIPNQTEEMAKAWRPAILFALAVMGSLERFDTRKEFFDALQATAINIFGSQFNLQVLKLGLDWLLDVKIIEPVGTYAAFFGGIIPKCKFTPKAKECIDEVMNSASPMLSTLAVPVTHMDSKHSSTLANFKL